MKKFSRCGAWQGTKASDFGGDPYHDQDSGFLDPDNDLDFLQIVLTKCFGGFGVAKETVS